MSGAPLLIAAPQRAMPLRATTVLGATGATLGALAGLVEVAVGPSIRAWIGNKHDTTGLGIATVALSALALAATLALARARPSPPRQFLLAMGVLVPALVCFTTVGRLWYVPGALLISSGVLTLVQLRGHASTIIATAARNWTAILTAILGLFYAALGATTLGTAGITGIAGGLIAVALVACRSRIPLPLSLRLLLLAVAPFALLTWWSLVTPVLAVLIVTIGAFALAPPVPPRLLPP